MVYVIFVLHIVCFLAWIEGVVIKIVLLMFGLVFGLVFVKNYTGEMVLFTGNSVLAYEYAVLFVVF